jgi:glycosyltransferase involved in cell wall biosynthesis
MPTRLKVVTKLDWPSFRNVAETIRKHLTPHCTCTVSDVRTTKPGGRIIIIGTADSPTLRSVKALAPGSQVVFYATTEGISRLSATELRATHDVTIVAVSKFAKSMLEKSGLTVSGVVYHGIDMNDRHVDSRLYKRLREKFGKHRNILTVSANHLRKGLDSLLNAYRIVEACAPEASLILHSQPDGHYDLANQASAFHLRRFWLTRRFGKVSQSTLNALYKLCNIYVQPSRSEGFGLPILEAFRFNKPAIAVDAQPFNEIIKHKRIGILVAAKKITWSRSSSMDFKINEYADDDLATAIVKIIQDRELATRLQRGISGVKSRWDAKELYPDLLTYF